MLYRCYLVVCDKGESVFLRTRLSEAIDYAAKHHGVVVPMHGTDNKELQQLVDTARIIPDEKI